jgi:hypothetical protein
MAVSEVLRVMLPVRMALDSRRFYAIRTCHSPDEERIGL